MSKPFWRTKSLKEMNSQEWESLCDGCARCCLEKLEDEDTGKIYYTNIACRLLDCEACRCSDYENRMSRVKDCVKITPDEQFFWLPKTCAYRRVSEGKDLEWWHPLVSGDPNTVHEAGISVRGRVGAIEGKVRVRDYQDYLVRWPMLEPKGSSKKEKLEPSGSNKNKKVELKGSGKKGSATKRGLAGKRKRAPTLNPSPVSGGGKRA